MEQKVRNDVNNGASNGDNLNSNVFEKRKPNKFAGFLTVLGVLAFILSVVANLALYFLTLYFFVLIIIAALTLFIILLDEGFRSYFDKGEEFGEFAIQLYGYAPYISGVSIGLCALAFLIFALSKKASNRTVGMVINGILIVFNIILIVLNQVIKFTLS
jgi:hypothetical protein